MFKYIYWVKKDVFGYFRIEEIRNNDNETHLKEGGGIEMSTTSLQVLIHIRDALCAPFRFLYFITYYCLKIFSVKAELV